MWTHEQMRCKQWKGEEVRYIQPKRDGHRLTFFKQDDDRVVAFARRYEPHLNMWLRLDVGAWEWLYMVRDGLPRLSSVDGELWFPGRPASDVVTKVNEHHPDLKFTPFAVPYWCGRPVQSMEDAQKLCRDALLLTFEATRKYRGQTEEQLLAEAESLGLEGFVLKADNYSGWYKLKAEDTADCVVTGLKPGRPGKYFGMVGALVVSALVDGELTEVASVSGMDDHTRAQLSHADVGRVVEVRYQYVGAGGRLRHPRFVRWRDDKMAADVTEIGGAV